MIVGLPRNFISGLSPETVGRIRCMTMEDIGSTIAERGPETAKALGVEYNFMKLIETIGRYRKYGGRFGRYTSF